MLTYGYLRTLILCGTAIIIAAGCTQQSDSEVKPAKGYALAIGLDKVDPGHYFGWNGDLRFCETRAEIMEKIATGQGLEAEKLLTENATREAVKEKLAALASKLERGDLLVVSYCGHGGFIPDDNRDETDGQDETWYLFNGQLTDDELWATWAAFKEGVCILVFSDSCHSGTVLKMTRADLEDPQPYRKDELKKQWKTLQIPTNLIRGQIIKEKDAFRRTIERLEGRTLQPAEVTDDALIEKARKTIFVNRVVPPDVMINTFCNNREFYKKIACDNAESKEDPGSVKASLISISSCEDHQNSYGGIFTSKVDEVWNNGTFEGDHPSFYKEIKRQVNQIYPPNWQSPKYATYGKPNPSFENQRPYTITIAPKQGCTEN